MSNVASTIQPKSDQLNADDLITGPITIKVSKVSLAAGDQPIAINYEGDKGKPYKPCKSMRRVLVMIWGGDGNAYVGRSMTLYRDPDVTWGGAKVGGIRISHMTGLREPVTVALTASKTVRKPYTVEPLREPEQPKPASKETVEAGDAAAAQGVDAYVKWRDALPEYVRETIRPHNAEWSKKAKAVDAAKAAPPNDEEIP